MLTRYLEKLRADRKAQQNQSVHTGSHKEAVEGIDVSTLRWFSRR